MSARRMRQRDWWNGGVETSAVGAEGWYGAYLTAYDTGLFGGYGIFTGHETRVVALQLGRRERERF